MKARNWWEYQAERLLPKKKVAPQPVTQPRTLPMEVREDTASDSMIMRVFKRPR